jgi:hypothetical protein
MGPRGSVRGNGLVRVGPMAPEQGRRTREDEPPGGALKSEAVPAMLPGPPATVPGEFPFPEKPSPVSFLQGDGRRIPRTNQGVGVANRPERPSHPGETVCPR